MSKQVNRHIRRISAPLRIGRALACLFIGGLVLSSLVRIFDEATKAARLPSCMSNIKQLTRAINLYAQDWDDGLPAANAWRDAARNYEEGRRDLQCPESAYNPPIEGYAYNSNLSFRKRKEISNPATAPLLYDSDLPGANSHAPGRIGLADPPRHNGHRHNALGFLDGHVTRVTSDSNSLEP